MKIGFDAKRAFLNASGLGNYSRTLIHSLAKNFPGNRYTLYSPLLGNIGFKDSLKAYSNVSVVTPTSFLEKTFHSYWRSYSIISDIRRSGIDIFHGLSNELPFNIGQSTVKRVVTIHDLIFIKLPELYPAADRYWYNKKVKFAVNAADIIVATSEQTKRDIVEVYKVRENKIKVVYQACNEVFLNAANEREKKQVAEKYKLPPDYILTVGTIEKRKNLLLIIKALKEIKDIHLVAVGRKKSDYLTEVKKVIGENKLSNRIHFIDNVRNADLPVIYQLAKVFVYPSFYEGFGIPVIEALLSKIPVIASNTSCLPEIGGSSPAYINPNHVDELVSALQKFIASSDLRKQAALSGYEYAVNKYSREKLAGEMNGLYKSL